MKYTYPEVRYLNDRRSCLSIMFFTDDIQINKLEELTPKIINKKANKKYVMVFCLTILEDKKMNRRTKICKLVIKASFCK